MLFPEDGCLPRITRSGLAPFNNVMIIKVPEQFRKPGETIFQLATLDPSKKTERWPADKFIYENLDTEEVTASDCSQSDLIKEKESEKSKFGIEIPKSLFALEKQRLKEKLSTAINSDQNKRISPNAKNYENHHDFKNQNARNHQDVKKSFATKTYPDNRGFRNRDCNDGKSHYDTRYNNKEVDINPWINPPLEYINPRYDESLNISVNELENPTVDLLRQQNETSHYYDAEGVRIFGHTPVSHLNDVMPIKNQPNVSQPNYLAYQEQPPRNANWQRPPTIKRSLLNTPPRKLFDSHLQRNPSETYFDSTRNISEQSDFSTTPWRGMHNDESLDFNNSYNSYYDTSPGFQYGGQYSNIPRIKSEFVNDRNYTRNSREDSSFHRNHSNDPSIPFSNNLSKTDSYRNEGFHRPYQNSGNGLEYQGRRCEQNSDNDKDFRKPEGRGFRPRNQNNRRDHRGRNRFRSSYGHRYAKGQRSDRFQKKIPDK